MLGRALQRVAAVGATALRTAGQTHGAVLPSVTALRPAAVPAASAVASPSPILIQSQSMRVRASLRKLCNNCQYVRRKGRLYVVCKKHPRHKQKQG